MKPADYHERANVYAMLKRVIAAGDYYARRNLMSDIREEHGDRFADQLESLIRARSRA